MTSPNTGSAILSLARPEILALRPYESARSLTTEGRVFLDANESPLSPVEMPQLNRYPEPQPRALLERFSQLYGVSPAQLLIGRGSDEAIDLLVRAFCEPGRDQILICPPTYGMYEVSARIQGAQIQRIPLRIEANEIDIDEHGIFHALSASNSIKILFICSPNNPTGTAFSPETLTRICEASKNQCLVVVDEAYAEFREGASITECLSLYPQLVVLRTLSKAWAAAGARCGVAIANEEVIQLLQKIRPPYPLSAPAIQAVLEATDSTRQNLLEERIKTTRFQRDFLKSALLGLPSVKRVYPSSTNFLLVKFYDCQSALKSLKSQGIIVRDRSKEPGLENCVRITVGTQQENQLLITTLQGSSL